MPDIDTAGPAPGIGEKPMGTLKLVAAAVLGLLVASPDYAMAQDLSAADTEAAFAAAGFTLQGNDWRSACGRDDPSSSYGPGLIDTAGDFNGDGRLDAVITEGGSFCYGMAGLGFSIVSQQADGNWKLMASDVGMPLFLQTTGADGWPDIAVGGPGFCFPVIRWDGSAYIFDRYEYEGAVCTPN
jgi:hypothetical protein